MSNKMPGTIVSGAYAKDPSLSAGTGFYLQPDGMWGIGEISEKVARESQFSGYLTIYGYKSAVFEMPNGSQFAQKVSEPVATEIASLCKMASKIAILLNKYNLTSMRLVPSSGNFTIYDDNDEEPDLKIDFTLKNVGYTDVDRYDDLVGSVSINGGPVFQIHASMGSNYRATFKSLTCSDPSINVDDYNTDLFNAYLMDFGSILWDSVVEVIRGNIGNNKNYVEKDGILSDFIIQNDMAVLK